MPRTASGFRSPPQWLASASTMAVPLPGFFSRTPDAADVPLPRWVAASPSRFIGTVTSRPRRVSTGIQTTSFSVHAASAAFVIDPIISAHAAEDFFTEWRMRFDIMLKRASAFEEAFVNDLLFDHGIVAGSNLVSRFPEMFGLDTT